MFQMDVINDQYVASLSVDELREQSFNYAESVDWIACFAQGDKASSSRLFSQPVAKNVLVEVEPVTDSALAVFVNIGLGVYLGMTSQEAVVYAEKESARLSAKADEKEQKLAQQLAIGIAIERSQELTNKAAESKP